MLNADQGNGPAIMTLETGHSEWTSAKRESSELSRCPDCRYNGFNRLADGRYQCRRCRKKYTPRQRKSRLPGKVIREIAGSFWLMAPAASSCGRLGLNRKTIQRYYLILRLRITRNRERILREVFGDVSLAQAPFAGLCPAGPARGEHGRYPVFGTISRGGEVWVVFPGKSAHAGQTAEAQGDCLVPDYWVYARDLGAFERKEIDRFACTAGTGREEFWPFARRRLKRYYGGFKKNFPLFIREMEFRYNHRDDPDAVAYLVKLLPLGPE